MQKQTVLCVDDNSDDCLLLKTACRGAGVSFSAVFLYDGQKAIDYMAGAGEYVDREKWPFPVLMLLDLKMPRKNGFDVLAWMLEHGMSFPVAMFTSSQDERDIRKCYQQGASWFLMKPIDFKELVDTASAVNRWIEKRGDGILSSLPNYRPAPGKQIAGSAL